MNPIIIGQRLRTLRGDRPQSEIACAVGVTTMAISQYENGERVPRDEIKIKLAALFGDSVDHIFFNEG